MSPFTGKAHQQSPVKWCRVHCSEPHNTQSKNVPCLLLLHCIQDSSRAIQHASRKILQPEAHKTLSKLLKTLLPSFSPACTMIAWSLLAYAAPISLLANFHQVIFHDTVLCSLIQVPLIPCNMDPEYKQGCQVSRGH